jgi:hypothetical protein
MLKDKSARIFIGTIVLLAIFMVGQLALPVQVVLAEEPESDTPSLGGVIVQTFAHTFVVCNGVNEHERCPTKIELPVELKNFVGDAEIQIAWTSQEASHDLETSAADKNEAAKVSIPGVQREVLCTDPNNGEVETACTSHEGTITKGTKGFTLVVKHTGGKTRIPGTENHNKDKWFSGSVMIKVKGVIHQKPPAATKRKPVDTPTRPIPPEKPSWNLTVQGACATPGTETKDAKITGRVMDPHGNPFVGADVTIELPDGTSAKGSTESTGEYEHLFVDAKNYIDKNIVVKVGDLKQVLTIENAMFDTCKPTQTKVERPGSEVVCENETPGEIPRGDPEETSLCTIKGSNGSFVYNLKVEKVIFRVGENGDLIPAEDAWWTASTMENPLGDSVAGSGVGTNFVTHNFSGKWGPGNTIEGIAFWEPQAWGTAGHYVAALHVTWRDGWTEKLRGTTAAVDVFVDEHEVQYDGKDRSTNFDAKTHEYVVQKGDTLMQICIFFDVPLWLVAQQNGIKKINLIQAGQVLELP